MKYILHFLIILLSVSCAPAAEMPATAEPLPPDTVVTSPPEDTMPATEPPAHPLAPKPGDDNLKRGEVFVQESDLIIRESFPPQISLNFSGDLPTPCHELRAVVNHSDKDNKIMVEVYSLVDLTMVCAQVLKPFQESIDLETYPSGHYTVWLNGEIAGEFDT